MLSPFPVMSLRPAECVTRYCEDFVFFLWVLLTMLCSLRGSDPANTVEVLASYHVCVLFNVCIERMHVTSSNSKIQK